MKGDAIDHLRTYNTLTVTTLGVFRLHLSVLLPCEWWGRVGLNHPNIEAVLIKRQPGDYTRKTKQASLCWNRHYKHRIVCAYKNYILLKSNPESGIKLSFHQEPFGNGPFMRTYVRSKKYLIIC